MNVLKDKHLHAAGWRDARTGFGGTACGIVLVPSDAPADGTVDCDACLGRLEGLIEMEEWDMFEHYTERARKVMSLARQEAQRMNSEFIGTEHILLGVMEEGGGVGVAVLKNLAVDDKAVRAAIHRIITPSTSPTVSLGQLPFSPRAKTALELAAREAESDGSEVVGTGYLVLGLYMERESIAFQALSECGVTDLDRVKAEVRRQEAIARGGRTGIDWAIAPSKRASAKLTIRLFMEANAAGWESRALLVAGKAYLQGETITLSGIAREKARDVAAAIAKEHGTDTFIIEIE